MEVAVTPDHAQAIQIGRTVVIVEMKKEVDLKERMKSGKNHEKGEVKQESKKLL